MNVSKADIVKNISKKSLVSSGDARNVLESFLSLIKNKSKLAPVKLSSFGSFSFKKTPKRLGRNPNTSDSYIIPELNKLNFKSSNNNLITWGQSVKIGVGISIISALIGIIYNLIFINFIEPDFMTLLMEKQVVAWEELNMTEEQIEASKSMMETFSSPAITSAIGIIAAAFFGFIISAIAGAIMKKTEEDQY